MPSSRLLVVSMHLTLTELSTPVSDSYDLGRLQLQLPFVLGLLDGVFGVFGGTQHDLCLFLDGICSGQQLFLLSIMMAAVLVTRVLMSSLSIPTSDTRCHMLETELTDFNSLWNMLDAYYL
jgi:hypothetical protein